MKSLLAQLADRAVSGMVLGSFLSLLGVMCLDLWYCGWERSCFRRVLVRPSASARLDMALAGIYAIGLHVPLAAIFSLGATTFIPAMIARRLDTHLVQYLPGTA